MIEKLREYADEIDRRIASGYFQPCGSDASKLMREAAAELGQLRESLHYCNGTAELAMKHRDAAEGALQEIADSADTLDRCKSVAKTALSCFEIEPLPHTGND